MVNGASTGDRQETASFLGGDGEDKLLVEIRSQIRKMTVAGVVVLALMGLTIAVLIGALLAASSAAVPLRTAVVPGGTGGTERRTGFDDPEFYANHSGKFVGAHQMISFSAASSTLLVGLSAQNPGSGNSLVGHGLPEPEALCNCECHGASDFVYCYHTAKTTAGISTFAYDVVDQRWEGEALRNFLPGSPGVLAGRGNTVYLHKAVLPDGPGGETLFTVSYMLDNDGTVSGGNHMATIVRGRTAPPSCDAARLCDVQCSGATQYELWKERSCDL